MQARRAASRRSARPPAWAASIPALHRLPRRAAIVAAVDRVEIARSRRRQAALDTLELERERESILQERFEETIGYAEAWRVDEEALARLTPDEAELLRAIQFAELQAPDEEAVQRLEDEIAEIQQDIEECRRRQQALARYVDALEG